MKADWPLHRPQYTVQQPPSVIQYIKISDEMHGLAENVGTILQNMNTFLKPM